jgi:mannose/fructose/N-acetylgalactosamine-specific phosphotransferase system component IIC
LNRAILGTWLLGGFAALDATPVAQTLFSQPLFTATILGFLWGDLPLAIEVGVVLQILAASTLPVGARTPEDFATGGVVGTGLALALATRQPFEQVRDSCALVGVIAGLATALLGVPVLKWQRRRNEGLARWAEAEVHAGNEHALGAAQGAAVLVAFGAGVALTALALGLGARAFYGAAVHQSIRLSRAWEMAHPLWIGLGLAHLLNAFLQRRLTRAALFAASLIGAWLFRMARFS